MGKFISAILTLIFTIAFNSSLLAHPEGHYKKTDLTSLHHWNLNCNQQQVIGNFLMQRNDLIVIEGIEGKMWTIKMNQLDDVDQAYANGEIEKINRLNGFNASEGTSNHSSIYFMYLLIFGAIAITFYGLSIYAARKKMNTNLRLAFSILSVFAIILFFVSCKKDEPNNGGNGNGTNVVTGIPKTTTSFIDSAFTPYKPKISTNWDTTYFYVSSTGIPNHNMMVGISSWQQQVPIPQDYSGTNHWSIPLQPVYATTPMSTRTNFMKGAVAIAVNGIPIFNALNNRGEDSYLIGELDQWGGHCGKGDDYHYHAAPLSLSTTSGLKPIAFALDGFAVYGAKEPDGTTMQTLDTCHGHIYNNGVYHYHGTTNYPYVVGAMKGKVVTDPTTPAPENQILPQAFAHPIRPALTPLRNAVITGFTAPTSSSYNLTYQLGNRFGHVNYNWTTNGAYHFEFIDTAGVTTTANY